MARPLATRESVRFHIGGGGAGGAGGAGEESTTSQSRKRRRRAQLREVAITFEGRKVFDEDGDDEQQLRSENKDNGKEREGLLALGSSKVREAEDEAASKKLEELGCELAESGKLAEALDKWQDALRLTPKRAVLFDLRAQVLLEQEDTWPALRSATRAVALDPSWADAHVTLGHAQLNFGEPELALQSAERALELDPENKQAKHDQGVAREILASRKREGRAFVTVGSHTRWKMVEREETDFA